jgi:hypothetical protein
MEMKLFQIVDNHMNERFPSSVTAATKQEAIKGAGAEINRLTDILKKHSIVTDRDAASTSGTDLNKDPMQVDQHNKRKRGTQC